MAETTATTSTPCCRMRTRRFATFLMRSGVHNERILDALEAGYIPVVAGFQGIDANGDITT